MREGTIATDGPTGTVLSAGNAALLASTGLEPPPLALLAAALGIDAVPATPAALLAILAPRA